MFPDRTVITLNDNYRVILRTVNGSENGPSQNRFFYDLTDADILSVDKRRKMASEDGEVLDMGHKGAGENCVDKTAAYAMNGALAGV